MNIAFIGPRRAGKSFISRELSRIIDFPLLSTDSIASYELGGLSIEQFIKNNSWTKFRDIEFKILKKLEKSENIILDCGGGFIFDIIDGKECLSNRKVEILKKNFIVINITRSFEELLEKKSTNLNNRPILSENIDYRDILVQRMKHYEFISDHCFIFQKNNIDSICNKINQIINLTK